MPLPGRTARGSARRLIRPGRAGRAILLPAIVLLSITRAAGDFSDVTELAGVSYIQGSAEIAGSDPLLHSGGASVVDINGDGWLDLYVTRLSGGNLLFVNNRDGTFSERASQYGIAGPERSNGAIFVDIDNDGDPDLVLSVIGGIRHYLYVNNGDGTFTEQAELRGADVTDTAQPHNGFSISAVDFDRDGWLDLHFSEHFLLQSGIDPATHTVLLRNRGAAQPGYFDNVTARAGLAIDELGRGSQFAFTSIFADFDHDGWPDLALASDIHTSRMFWNNGDGTFTDATVAAGLNQEANAMGATVGDYDGDGFLDLYVTAIFDNPGLEFPEGKTGSRLYRYSGGRRFAETSLSMRVRDGGWGWGAQFFDHDNDGDLDLVATNGLLGTRLTLTPEQTRFWINNGTGSFTDAATAQGIVDRKEGTALLTFDYDSDGDLDLFIVNNLDQPVLYRNDAAPANRWLRLRLEGSVSNRDAYGAQVRIEPGAGQKAQYTEFNPTNLFLAQSEPVVHFGLGNWAGPVGRVTITWPSGAVQVLNDLATNQVHRVVEPGAPRFTPPVFTGTPAGGTFDRGGRITLNAPATGFPSPVYAWFKDGVRIDAAVGPTLTIRHAHPTDAGTYTVVAANTQGTVESPPMIVGVDLGLAGHSAARVWNEACLDAIRLDFPRPTVHARNLFHLSVATWDAWVAYDTTGVPRPYLADERGASAANREEARREAIGYAAYRLLVHRYANAAGGARSLAAFALFLREQGFDPANTTTTGGSPAAVGNRIAAAVIAHGTTDGANEAGDYADLSGYVPANDPLIIKLPGAILNDPNRWQPLAFDFLVTQNGIPVGAAVQTFTGVNWGAVKPFAITRRDPGGIYLEPPPPPWLGTDSDAEYKASAVEVIRYSSLLDPALDETIDLSPSVRGRNTLGANDGKGHPDVPPSAYRVKLADYGRVLAEFWADGPTSETPPGHWNALANHVSDHPQSTHRVFGRQPAGNRLEWDAKLYLALNGALHDAAIVAWDAKGAFDYVRPISMIRHLCANGQSSDSSLPSYHPSGMPLVPGLIELITPPLTAPGQKFAHLAGHENEIAVHAWQGEPADPSSAAGGVGWILGIDWLPYQRANFVTPPFAGYVSGHSTFSRAAAEVLALFTGSPVFPGGSGEFLAPRDDFLVFERGPTQDVRLTWRTYFDAADEAGLSRLYGGIHIPADDFQGRIMGSRAGLHAFKKARTYYSTPARMGNPLANISLRGRTGSGSETLIAGFVLEGTENKPLLLRGAGPSLTAFGVDDACVDPSLTLYSGQSPLSTNDDWGVGTDPDFLRTAFSSAGAFAFPSGSRDAALVSPLKAGGYTVHLRSGQTGDGIALAEIYDMVALAPGRLVNISARGRTGSNGAVLIAGFVLRDTATILTRAVGPGLASFDVDGATENPRLTLWRIPGGSAPNELIGTSDSWMAGAMASAVEGYSELAGAFPLERGSADAAMVVVLEPGSYSAVVSNTGGTQGGIALVEVYVVE